MEDIQFGLKKIKQWFWSCISVFGVLAITSVFISGRKVEMIEHNAAKSITLESTISDIENKLQADREQHHKDILYIRTNMITKDDLKYLIQAYKNDE